MKIHALMFLHDEKLNNDSNILDTDYDNRINNFILYFFFTYNHYNGYQY